MFITKLFTAGFILIATLLVLPSPAWADLPSAVNYLKTQTLDDWTAQALVAAGEPVDPSLLPSFAGSSATDYAKRIMALVVAGKNPTNYTATDLVAGLRSFELGGQLGDISLLNDDAWGIMALASVGASPTDTLIKSSAQFLVAHQNADGGWSWSIGFDSDTNDTAAVLMALADAGYTIANQVIRDGLAYLAAQQNADAGFPYQLPCFWPGCEASDSASTSWVISALTKLQQNPASWTKGSATPQDFLLTLQTGDGSFKWQAADAAGNQAMTAYAVVALADKSYPVKRGNYIGGHGNRPTPMADLAIKFLNSGISGIKTKSGEQFGLKVGLVNNGPTMAQGVAAELILPESVTIIAAQASDGEFVAADKKWTFIRFNNYATADLWLVLTASAPLTDSIKINVSALELDFNKSNNEAVVSLEVEPELTEDNRPATNGEVLGEVSYACEPALPAELAVKWLGYIVSYVGSPWYVDPASRISYCLSDSAAAYSALGKFGLGITNENLAKIPLAEGEPVTVDQSEIDEVLVKRLSGRILLQVESVGEAWYVNPWDNKRYYLANGPEALRRWPLWQVTPAAD